MIYIPTSRGGYICDLYLEQFQLFVVGLSSPLTIRACQSDENMMGDVGTTQLKSRLSEASPALAAPERDCYLNE